MNLLTIIRRLIFKESNRVPKELLDNNYIKCRRCKDKLGYWRHQRTSYIDEKQNWVFECDDCYEQTEGYWNDMWSDYYNNCM